MTIQFVQINSATPAGSVTTIAATFSLAQAVGNLIIVAVGWNDTTHTISSVVDSSGNTYALAVGPTSGTGLRHSIYYAKNIASAAANANTVTVTMSGATPAVDLRVVEYSGLDTVNPFDVNAAGSGTGNPVSSGNATTTKPNELIFGANVVQGTTLSAGTGFNNRIITVPNGDIAEDQIVSAAGSYAATSNVNSGAWVMQMAAFAAPPLANPLTYFAIDNTGKITVTAAGAANIAAQTYTLTVQATNTAGSGTGAITVNTAGVSSGWVDGLANAPTGTPQQPNLLNNYFPAGRSAGRDKANGYQPPFNVPGVDYRVGINTGVTLQPVSSMSIAGVTVSGTTIHVTGNNVVIDGFDCSNYQIWQDPAAHNLTVRNCKWVQTSQIVPLNLQGAGGYVGYCSVNGGGLEYQNGGAIVWNGPGFTPAGDLSGNWVIEYCEMFNFGVDILHQQDGSGTGTLTVQFNYFHDNANEPSAVFYHPDLCQIIDASSWAFKLWNNCYYSPSFGSQGFMTPGSTAFPSFTCQNVMIGQGGFWFSAGTGSLSGGQTYTFHDNYGDRYAGSAGDYLYPGPPVPAGVDFNNNIVMTTGQPWPGYSVTTTSPPVVTGTTLSLTIPATSGTAVGTVAATNSPTAWSITAGNASGYFAIDNTGKITVTTAGASGLTAISYNLTVQATNVAGSGTGTVTINAVTAGSWVDGLALAPTGAPQNPTALNNYHPTGQSAGRNKSNGYQPPFNVPGVDYRVGINTGVVLKSIVGNVPTGCTWDGTNLHITGTNVTVDGFDFPTGATIHVNSPSGTVTIRNCRLHCAAGQVSLIHMDAPPSGQMYSANVYIGYCEFQANGTTGTGDAATITWDTGGFQSTGTFTIEYCWLHSSGYDCIRPQGGYFNFVLQYNYFDDMRGGGHPDVLQQFGTTQVSSKVWNNFALCNVGVGVQGFGFDPGNAPPCTLSQNVFVNPSGGISTCMSIAGTGFNAPPYFQFNNNYCVNGTSTSGFTYSAPPTWSQHAGNFWMFNGQGYYN